MLRNFPKIIHLDLFNHIVPDQENRMENSHFALV